MIELQIIIGNKTETEILTALRIKRNAQNKLRSQEKKVIFHQFVREAIQDRLNKFKEV